MEPGRPEEEGREQEEEWVKDSEVNAEEEQEGWAGRNRSRSQPGMHLSEMRGNDPHQVRIPCITQKCPSLRNIDGAELRHRVFFKSAILGHPRRQ